MFSQRSLKSFHLEGLKIKTTHYKLCKVYAGIASYTIQCCPTAGSKYLTALPLKSLQCPICLLTVFLFG